MALANYSDLVAAIGNWLNRSDLTARIPEFIALAEAEFNRRLRTMDMEARATATLTSDAIAIPTDFIGLRSIKIATTQLDYVAPDVAFDDETTGVPSQFTVSDGQFFFRPAPTSGTVTIDYYAKIPALTATNTTNWLMTKHPDLYLFATLAQAEFYGWNDNRLPRIIQRVEEIIDQVETSTLLEKHGGMRMVPNLGVPTLDNP